MQETPTTPIDDYALIGDGRAAALVSRSGSIDWLCWPAFDRPSLFGALLDPVRGGCFRITPIGASRVERAYLKESNVLHTRFVLADGVVGLTDLMPVLNETDDRRELSPEHELVRRVTCERGEAEIEVCYQPRPDYGRVTPEVRDRGPFGLAFETGGALVTLRTSVPFAPRLRLKAGQSIYFSLTWAQTSPGVMPPLGAHTELVISRAIEWWSRWAARAEYRGPHRDAVVRSALTLKLLQYAPSGAIIAAPTTSLPERIGDALNWDYRYCWLRDASMTGRALFGLGYHDEGEAFVSWLLHATHRSRPRMKAMYDLFGREAPRERTLPHLSGHRGSQPVRIGNGARDQLQLDVWGEVIDAATRMVRHGHSLDRDKRALLCDLGEYLCVHAQEPDEGIWEPRGGRRHHTHSRVLCWAGLDRLLELHGAGHLDRAQADRFAKHRAILREEIERRAWNERLSSYTGTLDGDDLDASVLLLPYHGFESASSARMRLTYARLRERLGAGRGLMRRYLRADGRLEGAFGICGFWAVEYLARGGGSLGDARAAFEQLLEHRNDLGLCGEEVDPETGAQLGNFPQGFTHLGLISAALAVEERAAQEQREPVLRAGSGAYA